MFSLLLFISFLVLADFRLGFIAAFLYGVFVDLTLVQNLGISSLKFILIALIINLYKRKFNAENMLFVLPVTFFILLYFKMENSYFAFSFSSLKEVFAYTLIMYGVFFILVKVKYLFVKKEESMA